MTTHTAEISPRRAALIAGAGYVTLFVLGIFSNFFVLTALIEPGDTAATFANIAEAESLFRMGIMGFLVVFLVDVIVAWALYVLFREVARDVSLLAAWFRLIYTVFLGVALIFLSITLQLIGGADYLNVFESGQLDAQVTLLLEAFNFAWLIGLAGFGIHLMLLGYLVLKTKHAPRVLGILVLVAGAAYVLDTTANILLSNYADYETLFLTIVAVPAVVGELAFTLWLLFKAGRHEVTERPKVAAGARV